VAVDALAAQPAKPPFRIVQSSHPWLSTHVKGVLAQWRFSPAELAGCKVARVYHFSATAPPRKAAH
jgi:hypothetical protein